MKIVETSSGDVCEATVVAETKWDFIEHNLDGYYSDRDVTLSNDIAVVLEVIDEGCNPYEYIKEPENRREFSDVPFEHVSHYVDDLSDKEALQKLQDEVDETLFERAVRDHKAKRRVGLKHRI